jgi:hypothetical protein
MSVSSPILYSHDVADSELRLPLADDRQSLRQPSASPKESGCRSWILRTASADQARARPESSRSARPSQLGQSLGRAASHASFKHWDLDAVRLCSTRRSMLIEPALAHPPEASGVHNRDPQSGEDRRRSQSNKNADDEPHMLPRGNESSVPNARRRQRHRRSLAESTGIAARRRSGLIRRLNVNLSCGNWSGVHSCCELVA